MVDQTTGSSGRRTDVAADIADAGNRLEEERKALSGTMGEASDAVAAQARDLKDQAAGMLAAETESMKEEAAAGLTAFSDALKAASGELSGKKLGFAGDMVQQAADGLESFVRAIEGRSPGEMLDGIRAFGRQNPVGFIAGSVLAGFALGRIAAVVPTGTSPGASSEPASRGSASMGGTFMGDASSGSSATDLSGTGSSATGSSGAAPLASPSAGRPFGTGTGTSMAGTPHGDGVPPRGGSSGPGSTPTGGTGQ